MAELNNILISLLFVILPLLCVSQTLESDTSSNSQEVVPVLMWGSGSVNSVKNADNSALAKLESDQFERILVKQVSKEKPLILLFIEENLSSEDFVIGASTDVKPFSKLHKLSDTSSTQNFFPSVDAPLEAIKNLKSKGYKWVTQSLKTEPNVKKDTPIILAINLNDLLENESRLELLQRHDNAISKLYNKMLQEHNSILAIYTGRSSSWSEGESHHRVRRLLQATEEKDANNGTLIVDKDNKTMLYLSYNPMLNISGSSPIQLKNPTVTTVDQRGDMQKLIVTFSDPQKIVLRFRFNSIISGYWNFGEVEAVLPNATVLILSTKTITVPFNFSYHCSGYDTIFRNSSTVLILKDFQVQPFLNQQKFDDAYDCVYFFTIPILSGFFVTTFLALIMSWGLCMILDIKTMDRFDDPKGKTISINVSE